jgi:hypothetical protein
MHQSFRSIFNNYMPFLLVRRGIPIIGILLFLILAIFKPPGAGWCLIGITLLLVEVEPTFRRGNNYINFRNIIVQKDAFWVNTLKPIFRFINKEDAWVLSFCHWNNYRIQQEFKHRKATRALLLLPHCIQDINCNADIITDLRQCYDCGLCVISEILQLQEKYGWQIRVANRSHKAYKEAEEYCPELIIAISCLDRIFKGITKLSRIPSYAIPLTLNHGMCVNTSINISQLELTIRTLIE